MSSAKESASKPSAAANKKTASPTIRYPFWFGGSASSMAACVTHPLDLGMFLFSDAVPGAAVAPMTSISR